MPIIIDANRSGDFSEPVKIHAAEILKRMAANRMRVAVGGLLYRELARTKIRPLLVEWARSGRLIVITDAVVEEEQRKVVDLDILSDDPHVLALARAAKIQLLYTDDAALMKDFKRRECLVPRGRIVTSNTAVSHAVALFNLYAS